MDHWPEQLRYGLIDKVLNPEKMKVAGDKASCQLLLVKDVGLPVGGNKHVEIRCYIYILCVYIT